MDSNQSVQFRPGLQNVRPIVDHPRRHVPSMMLKWPLNPGGGTKGGEDEEYPLHTRPAVATSHGQTGVTLCAVHSCACDAEKERLIPPLETTDTLLAPREPPSHSSRRTHAAPCAEYPPLQCHSHPNPLLPLHARRVRFSLPVVITAHPEELARSLYLLICTPPSTPAAMFYLQNQMTYIPSLEPCTRVACRSSPSPAAAALPLAPGRHRGCGSEAELEWARTPAQSHPSQLSTAQ